jgi:signal recognition particle GTPase
MSKIMSSIPGLSGAMEGMSDEDTGAKLKRMIYIMDSMRTDELDSDGLIFVGLRLGTSGTLVDVWLTVFSLSFNR